MTSKREQIINQLNTLVGFIENMESIAKNPYSAGLKTDELLRDVKNFVNETKAMVESLEECEDNTQPDEEEKAE